MNSKNLFIFNAIICFLFAIPLLIIPAQFLSQYIIEGDQLGIIGTTLSKAYGGMILALGIALWLGRNAGVNSLTRKILLWYLLIGNLGALYGYLPAALSGSLRPLIYSTICLTLVLTIWAALLLIKKNNES